MQNNFYLNIGEIIIIITKLFQKSEMKKMNETLKVAKEEIIHWANAGKLFKSGRILVKTVKGLNSSNIESYGEFFIELLKFYLAYPKADLHFSVQSTTRKGYSKEILKALDIYILTNACLAPGEEIIRVFYGSLNDEYSKIIGRMFLTNIRIIACGIKGQIASMPMVGKPRLGKVIKHLRTEFNRINTTQAISGSLQDDVKEADLLVWGYSYPLIDGRVLKKSKSSLKFNINVSYELKGEEYDRLLTITLNPDKSPDRMEILNDIESRL